jgi:hypothetical protein
MGRICGTSISGHSIAPILECVVAHKKQGRFDRCRGWKRVREQYVLWIKTTRQVADVEAEP